MIKIVFLCLVVLGVAVVEARTAKINKVQKLKASVLNKGKAEKCFPIIPFGKRCNSVLTMDECANKAQNIYNMTRNCRWEAMTNECSIAAECDENGVTPPGSDPKCGTILGFGLSCRDIDVAPDCTGHAQSDEGITRNCEWNAQSNKCDIDQQCQ
mmetsp:Transcript_115/g.220  ORF Transcript_115/g.220 Transcript_115/m.220 type:complete len:155 (-) Transcript_115:263-727(-)